MQPNTLTRQEYKAKIYVKNIRKIHVGSGYGYTGWHGRWSEKVSSFNQD
jgi:hypothetical protein